jgi:hypothetical protein
MRACPYLRNKVPRYPTQAVNYCQIKTLGRFLPLGYRHGSLTTKDKIHSKYAKSRSGVSVSCVCVCSHLRPPAGMSGLVIVVIVPGPWRGLVRTRLRSDQARQGRKRRDRRRSRVLVAPGALMTRFPRVRVQVGLDAVG